MPRSSARTWSPAPVFRNRHGHGARGPVTGPHLPALYNRVQFFDIVVAQVADFLIGLWPEDLAHVSFEVAAAPQGALGDAEVRRWEVDTGAHRIILFRIPIQRLSRLHRNDEFHRRLMIEGCVFRAVAEYLGKDPWDLAPEQFRP